ncbi:DMT family transporter [Candidatus Neptunochlamydia vexilliferae]|uniref:S-adenosylmethionine/S-adenosylhomocysteine transporter n=1 Tax=Candidatus Neptunichlamydia vexilliferae TaxID=1651774 RepID=A0ABS0AZ50_9BACT|nr:DMT family transporter [Candidatus Neptunochlamydia vexilliferae]MBF5059405.1 S-adenosylmethionine/S-adenosylhomocysteine transporter [Candidatus Neptunochlamydia vexilliferae]
MSIFLVIFMYAAWSSVFSFGKMALENSPPVFLTAFRMLFAAILLLGWLFIKNRSSLKIGKKQILPLLALAVFSIYLTNILEFWGLQHLTAAKTCFIYSLSPFFAALFSYIHFGEKVNLKKFLGMMIGFAGFIPVLMLETGSEGLLSAFSIFSWPELAIMGAALFSVYGWVLLRIIVKNQTLSPLYANGYSMLLGGTMALIHSLVIDNWSPIPVTAGHMLPFAQGIMIMTLVSNILCYNLYGFMLKKYTATFLSFMGLLSPIFASINSWILLEEAPSWQILLSTSVVSMGLFIVYQAELKQGYIVKKGKDPIPAPATVE